METLEIKKEQVKNAILKSHAETVTFNVSFDEDAKKAGETHKVKAIIHFDDVTLQQLIQTATKPLNIKIQNGLRKMVTTAKSFAEMLEQNDFKFEYSYHDFQGGREANHLRTAINAVDKMDAEQLAELKKAMELKGLL